MARVTLFQGMGNSADRRGGLRSWSERSANERWRSIFLKGCLQRIEEQRMLQALTENPRSAGKSKRK